MSQAATLPTPRPGRTFTVAIAVLGALALGLALATAWALVRHLNLPAALPPNPAAGPVPGLEPRETFPAGGLPADLQGADQVPDLLSGRLTAPAGVSPAPPDILPENRPGAILDLEVLELVEVAAAMRADGDTASALKKLREADSKLPAQPRVLWEMAETFRALGLSEKRTAELEKIRELGAQHAGEYFQLASLALDSSAEGAGLHKAPGLGFGQTLVTPDESAEDGERVLVRLAIHSDLDKPIEPQDVAMIMEFYDLVDGTRIEETRSNEPISRWLTMPIDWAEAGSEIVEWSYHMPQLNEQEREAFGKRSYYGFVARLYYHDTLQDVFAAPRTLLARPQSGGPAPVLDDSLFPPGG